MAKSRIAAIAAFVVVLVPAILLQPSPAPTGADLPREIAKIEKRFPAVIGLGNSHLAAAVDPRLLTSLVGHRCANLWRGGAASACYYLMVKNVVIAAQPKPRFVTIFFMDNFLTLPTYRIEGNHKLTKIDPLSSPDEPLIERLGYAQREGALFYNLGRLWPLYRQRDYVKAALVDSVEVSTLRLLGVPDTEEQSVERTFGRVFSDKKMNPELLNRLQVAEEETSVLPADAYDFGRWNERSFLPPIIDLCERNGLRLILVRMKRRSVALGREEPAELERYMVEFRAYLERRQVALLDFSHHPGIRFEHFGEGDHLARDDIFTPLLAAELKPLLR